MKKINWQKDLVSMEQSKNTHNVKEFHRILSFWGNLLPPDYVSLDYARNDWAYCANADLNDSAGILMLSISKPNVAGSYLEVFVGLFALRQDSGFWVTSAPNE
jgi:hypothetical protein